MLASMTKTLTSVAALQLVEQGKVGLDQPLGGVVPELADLIVLEGFSAAGAPRLRPAKRPVTLRHLLTHTSGFGHDVWSADIARYQAATGLPPLSTQTNESLRPPLLFDPGDRWEYAPASNGQARSSRPSRAKPWARIYAKMSPVRWACPTPNSESRQAIAGVSPPFTGARQTEALRRSR